MYMDRQWKYYLKHNPAVCVRKLVK